MSIRMVTDDRIAMTSSKGNQEKWYEPESDRWYKLDQFGYEGLSETFISTLLQHSNIETDTPFTFARYRMERLQVHHRERIGCSSENFLQNGWSVITLYKLLNQHLGGTLQDTLAKMTSNKKRIQFLAEATVAYTGLVAFPRYLTLLFEIDALFLNDDRHLNNIAVIEKEGQYDYCPIFDNGAGLLSNVQISPLSIEPQALISATRAGPFDTTFIRQKNTAEALYGTVLHVPVWTKEDLYTQLQPILSYYPERDRRLLSHRVVTSILTQQKKCLAKR